MSLQDTLEQIMRRLDKIERDLEELKPPEYSSDVFTGFANPTASVVLVPVNGAATTAMRSDAAPPISLAINPVGGNAWTAIHQFSAGLRTIVDDSNVGNPPTDAQLDAAFGAPGVVGEGFVALVDDNDAATTVWLVASVGGAWWYEQLTKAV